MLEKGEDGTDGQGISFACFDDYFTTKLQDVLRYRAGIKARGHWEKAQKAAKIQSVMRGRSGRRQAVNKMRAKQIEERLGLSWPGWPDQQIWPVAPTWLASPGKGPRRAA